MKKQAEAYRGAKQKKKYQEEKIKEVDLKLRKLEEDRPKHVRAKKDASTKFIVKIISLKEKVKAICDIETKIAQESCRRAQLQKRYAATEAAFSEIRAQIKSLEKEVEALKLSLKPLKKTATDKLKEAQFACQQYCPGDMELKNFTPTCSDAFISSKPGTHGPNFVGRETQTLPADTDVRPVCRLPNRDGFCVGFELQSTSRSRPKPPKPSRRSSRRRRPGSPCRVQRTRTLSKIMRRPTKISRC